MSDFLERALENFKSSAKWSIEATEHEKTLVLGNLNGFVSHLRSLGLFPKQDGPSEPIEEQVCRVMADFRYRRLRYKVEHPETIETDDVPDYLTRWAEAHAIALLFPREPALPAPKSPGGSDA